jgi:hypothetical protein
MEKVLAEWPFDRQPDLHLLAANALCRFLDEQESMTRDARCIDRGIAVIADIMSRCDANENLPPARGEIFSALYGRLSNLYFKRAMHETGEKQRESWDLSKKAEQRALELRTAPSEDEES